MSLSSQGKKVVEFFFSKKKKYNIYRFALHKMNDFSTLNDDHFIKIDI